MRILGDVGLAESAQRAALTQQLMRAAGQQPSLQQQQQQQQEEAELYKVCGLQPAACRAAQGRGGEGHSAPGSIVRRRGR